MAITVVCGRLLTCGMSTIILENLPSATGQGRSGTFPMGMPLSFLISEGMMGSCNVMNRLEALLSPKGRGERWAV